MTDTKSPALNMQIPAELKELLESYASGKGASLAATVRQLLEESPEIAKVKEARDKWEGVSFAAGAMAGGNFVPAPLPMVVDIAPHLLAPSDVDTTELLATLPVVGWGTVTEPEGGTTSVQPFVQLVEPFNGPEIDDAGLMPADHLEYKHDGGWRPTRVMALRHGTK